MSNNSPERETCALDLNVDSISHCESSSVSYIKSEKKIHIPYQKGKFTLNFALRSKMPMDLPQLCKQQHVLVKVHLIQVFF